MDLKSIARSWGGALIEVDLFGLISSLLVGIVLSFILRWFYIKYGKSNSNRRSFSDNFVLLTICTVMIISLIKTSLALSLGLVGALSIVRFRAAIKDPEELNYLFFSIAIGLGLGAGQTIATISVFLITLPTLYIKNMLFNKTKHSQSMLMNLSLPKSEGAENLIQSWADILAKEANFVNLHRLDESENEVNATFTIDVSSFEKLSELRNQIIAKNAKTNVVVLDNSNPLALS